MCNRKQLLVLSLYNPIILCVHISLFLVIRSSVLSGSRHVRVSVLVVVVLVLGFMKHRSDEVEDAILHVNDGSGTIEVFQKRLNLRTDDGGNESAPWQLAVLAARNRLTGWAETSSVFFTARSTGATIRSGQYGHGNECTNEAEIQEHQSPANQFGLVLQDAAEDHGNESVENSSGQNANDGAIGGCKVATPTGWIFLNDLDEARGEEAD
jgi:hypothetical protein